MKPFIIFRLGLWGLVLFLSVYSTSLFSQGLTGPGQTTSGVPTVYQFSDDYLIAEPRWVTSGASIAPYSSGANYFAEVNWSESGEYELRFQDGEIVIASILVQVEGGCVAPPTPNAGADQIGSENCSKTNTQLHASSVPEGMTGQWNIVSGLGGTFSDPSSPTTIFTGALERDYVLRWTVGKDNCFSSDDILVRFHAPPFHVPSVSGNQRIGPGIFYLEATGSETGESYQWRDNQDKIISTNAALATDAIALTQTNYATVRFQNKFGCLSPARSISLLIEPNPTIRSDKMFLTPGEVVTLRTDASYDSYLWKDLLGNTIGLGPEVSIREAGYFQLEVTKSGYSGIGISLPFEVKSPFIVSARNRTVSHVPRKEIKSLAEAKTADVNITTTYIDGLGRPLQEIIQGWSPDFQDRVTPFIYDYMGRNYRQFLPLVHTGVAGSFRDNLLTEENLYRTEYLSHFNDTAPYTETIYEASPLSQPVAILEPGSNWKSANRPKRISSSSNVSGTLPGQERIIVWEVSQQTGLPVRSTVNSQLVRDGYYLSGALEVNSVKDEDGNETRTYRDQLGRVVLKKIQVFEQPILNDPLHWLQTYYIYDPLGRLRFILQPELVKNLLQGNRNPTSSEIFTMGFRYRYDALGRVVAAQEPGRDSVYMIYDHRDRVVLTQDGNQRTGSPYRWTFYKYDALNRMIAMGVKDTIPLLSQVAMQEVVNSFYKTKSWSTPFERFIGFSSSNVHGYSNRSYPVVTTGSIVDVDRYLKVIYFDQYQFVSGLKNPGLFLPNDVTGSTATTQALSGIETGKKVKVLDGGPTGGVTWLGTVTYYDRNLRPIQILSENYKGGTDVLSMNYDFNGQVVKKRRTHQSSDVTWRDPVGLYQQGNKLIRGNSSAGWTAGAISAQVLGQGQDGWLEFLATETSTIRAIGLSDQNVNSNYTSIDYALYLNSNGSVSIFEQAFGKFITGNFGTYRSGDQFRIERKSGIIRYYRNNVLLRTSTYTSNTSLMVDVSLNSPGSTIAGIRTSFSNVQSQIDERFVYDHQGRLLENWHKVDQHPELLLFKNEFDNHGRVKSKSLHSTSHLTSSKQRIDYRYNVRGWLESINDMTQWNTNQNSEFSDLFGEDIFYEKTDGTGNQPKFNGSLSSVRFRAHAALDQPKQTSLLLSYDPVNRIQTGIQKKLSSAQWVSSGNEEQVMAYDFNGNIRSLVRKISAVTVDDLMYQYSGSSNQVINIQDRSAEKFNTFIDGSTSSLAEYTYDRNGNLLTDLNKGVSQGIQYNLLDLPETVTRGVNRVQMVYSADGEKLAQTIFFTGSPGIITRGIRQVEWCGPFEYDHDQLKLLEHPEGRVVMQDSETIFFEDGTNKSAYILSGASIANTTLNGEKYLTITATSTTARSGIQTLGGSIVVKAGERYLIKVRGYRTPGTAKSSNPVYVNAKLNGVDVIWPGAALASSSVTEHEVEQLVDIYSSGTLTIGLTWNTVLVGEMIYLNQTEIIRLSPSNPVYQYYLKDHAENVRAVFTSNPKVDSRLATVEPSALNNERKQFLRFENAKLVTAALFDRTNGDLSGTSIRLNGSTNERYGLACSLSVMPGDIIEAEVWAKFLDSSSKNWTAALSSLVSSISSGSSTIVSDGASYSSSTTSFPYSSFQNTTGSSGSGPRAFLNWLVFDKKFNLLPQQSGYVRMTETAREYGQNVPHERLRTPSIKIQEWGYVYIYLSNEEATPLDVYFDDFSVINRHSPLLQTSDYFPFGSSFDEQLRENSIPSETKYNSMSVQTALGLGWLKPLRYRTYDPTQARFLQADPVVKDHESLYAWNTNNPLRYPDPFGADSVQRAKALQEAERYIKKNPDPEGRGGYGFAGYHSGTPGQPIDCSGMVSQCADVSGFGTLNNYVRSKPNNNGVRNILDQPLTREVALQDITEGNIIVFANNSHVAFISDIVRDSKDQVTGFTLIHSERSEGPNRDVIDLNNPNNYYVRKYLGVGGTRARYYSWDTPDKPLTPKQRQIQ